MHARTRYFLIKKIIGLLCHPDIGDGVIFGGAARDTYTHDYFSREYAKNCHASCKDCVEEARQAQKELGELGLCQESSATPLCGNCRRMFSDVEFDPSTARRLTVPVDIDVILPLDRIGAVIRALTVGRFDYELTHRTQGRFGAYVLSNHNAHTLKMKVSTGDTFRPLRHKGLSLGIDIIAFVSIPPDNDYAALMPVFPIDYYCNTLMYRPPVAKESLFLEQVQDADDVTRSDAGAPSSKNTEAARIDKWRECATYTVMKGERAPDNLTVETVQADIIAQVAREPDPVFACGTVPTPDYRREKMVAKNYEIVRA